MSITAAQQAKANKHLDTLIRTSAYGIISRRERVQKALVDGANLEVVTVRDEARERAIERELQSLRGRNGWGIPANECHPTAIAAKRLREELSAGPKCEEYRLHHPTGGYWNVLTKTEYEFARSIRPENGQLSAI